ncbi:hypothetical protein [Secundilactobacillus kimchicus]|uniref:hypothetical protein n=1 Tax=Secundilactobacillus kimchicus TaxID=528209 RepID=UPI000AFADBA0|nr:hypothetical protein [Secundilactobacillus kimchicus]
MATRKPYSRLTKVLVGMLVVVFSILLAGGWLIFKNEAPRPAQIVDQQGNVLISKKDFGQRPSRL